MEFIVDAADLKVIRRLYDLYPLEGITTNPTILAQNGQPPLAVLKELRAFLGEEGALHAQVTAPSYEGMLKDARKIVSELGRNTYVKVPATGAGFKLIRALKAEGIRVTATAIYSPMQAFLAAKAGADYAAPYVNRIDNLGGDGVAAALAIQEIFRRNALPCKLLAAGFKNSRQVMELCRAGVDACTISPEVIESLAAIPAAEKAVEDFRRDFAGLVGADKNMADL